MTCSPRRQPKTKTDSTPPRAKGARKDVLGAELRDYQADVVREVWAHISAGTRAVSMVLPTGAGKTRNAITIAAKLYTENADRLILILAPTTAIVRQFQEPGPYRDEDGVPLPWRDVADPTAGLPQATAAQVTDLEWLRETRGVYVLTRQAMGQRRPLDALRAVEGEDLGHVYVFADEAHHHHAGSLAGKLCAELRRLGAFVLYITATPYHKEGKLYGDDVAEVRRTAPWFAALRDEAGRPYCPGDWRFTQVEVGTSRSAADAFDTGARYEAKEGRIREVCAAWAARWVEDGREAAEGGEPRRPKLLVFLPDRKWAAPARRAFVAAGADPARVRDFTGDDLAPEDLELLERERKVKRYQDSEVDVILSCVRFNEGVDWPLCAMIYCWRVPNSVVIVLQRHGRAARGKEHIEGYPVFWRTRQSTCFFVPRLVGKGATEAWTKHSRAVLVLGLFLADYREALRWARVASSHGGADRPERPKRPPEPRETDELTLVRARELALRLARRPGATGGYVVDGLRSAFPTLSRGQAKAMAAAVTRPTETPEEEMARRRAKVEKDLRDQAEREARGIDWILEQREERFAALADELLERPAVVDEGVLRDLLVEIGARDLERYVERFRTDGIAEGYAWPETREGLIAFAQEHGRRYFEKYGKWPTSGSGSINGCAGATWAALEHLLRRHAKCSLCELFGRRQRGKVVWVSEAWADAIAEFIVAHHRDPRGAGRDLLPGERDCGTALMRMRAAKRWDLLDPRGVARKCDRAKAAAMVHHTRNNSDRDRLRAIGKANQGKRQFTLDLLIPICARHWRCGQLTKDIEGDSGAGLNQALANAHVDAKRGCSRGFGETVSARQILCQVNSLARTNDEIAADCWRLWLDGANKPDPRPWADILAAGDNKRVVKAERVAFLDWQRPGRDGKPARRPWPQAQWPDLRAEPTPQQLREAA